jgi:23S rRNA pseudouridine1911/1915/1917 synthase
MDTPVQNSECPRLITETGDFAVIYKPPRIHCVPLKPGEGGTLLEWYAGIFPPVMELRGKKNAEGGILHRLDYETHGLVLFGKNQEALENLVSQQEAGRFVKEYGALTTVNNGFSLPPAFPPPPEAPGSPPFCIASYFRPYGPGRKTVRPAAALKPGKKTTGDRKRPYETEVVGLRELGDGRRHFTLRIKRGFRHQIRCHLAWTGNPIDGDPLYGPAGAADGAVPPIPPGSPESFLALRAQALYFFDPRDGRPLEFRIPPIGG